MLGAVIGLDIIFDWEIIDSGNELTNRSIAINVLTIDYFYFNRHVKVLFPFTNIECKKSHVEEYTSQVNGQTNQLERCLCHAVNFSISIKRKKRRIIIPTAQSDVA